MNFLRLTNILFVLLVFGINAKAQIVLAYSTSEIICHGASNISITFSLNGGSPPYDYGWKRIGNNFIFIQGTLDADGQNETVGGSFYATSYIVEVVDAIGTMFTDTIVINEPPPLFVSETFEEPSCFNACDGSISLVAEGGVGNIEITWADIEEATPNRSELCQGSYFYFLIDENNCTQKGIIDLFEPTLISLMANIETPSCSGLENGSIQLSEIEGGAPPYSYNWEDGSHEDNLHELDAGTYSLGVEDANNCLLDTSFIITPGNELLPNVQINYGCGDGSILASINPIHAQEPYDIIWSTGSTETLLFGLSAGFYSLSITDALGCEGEEDFTVDFVQTLELNAQITSVSCPNAEDGKIEIEVLGGLAPFDFSWSNGTDNQNLANISGGDYTLNLSTDGCGISKSFHVPEASELDIYFIFDAGLNDLISATALVSGGNSPYFFSWSSGATEAIAHNLIPEQSYTLTITDSHNCAKTVEFDANLTGTLSIQDFSDIHLYPNPATDKVSMQIPFNYSYLTAESIRVFNSNGQETPCYHIYKNPIIELDVNHLPAGVYYISILTKNGRQIGQFIKL